MFIVVEPGESIVPPALPVFVQATVSPGFEGTDPTNTTEVLPSQKVALAGLIDAFVIPPFGAGTVKCIIAVPFTQVPDTVQRNV